MNAEWNESYSVGVKKFDEHHKKLFSIMTSLVDSSKKSNGEGPNIHNTLKELLDYTVYHVAEENKAMTLHGYPGFEKHKLEHDEFIAKINDYYSMIHYGSEPPASDIIEFLKDWIDNHICKTDQMYGPYLNGKGVK